MPTPYELERSTELFVDILAEELPLHSSVKRAIENGHTRIVGLPAPGSPAEASVRAHALLLVSRLWSTWGDRYFRPLDH